MTGFEYYLYTGGGYWEASAVAGNVAGGDNVGTYHVVCNHAGSWSGKYLEDDGSVTSGSAADTAAAQAAGVLPDPRVEPCAIRAAGAGHFRRRPRSLVKLPRSIRDQRSLR